MRLDKIKEILKVVVLVICILALPNLWWNVRLTLQQLNGSLHNINRASGTLADVAEVQREQLEQNKKSIDATLQLGAVFNGTGRLLNTQVLPRAMKTLDSTNDAVIDLQTFIQSGTLMLNDANTTLFGQGGLIPTATVLVQNINTTATKLNATVETTDRMLQDVAKKLNLTMDEIYTLVASPEWKSVLTNLDKTSINVANSTEKLDATMEQIRLASLNAPSIAASIEKISKTTSKYAKVSIIVTILSTIAKALLP